MTNTRVLRICIATGIFGIAFYFMQARDKREEARAKIEEEKAKIDEGRFELEKDDRKGMLNANPK